MPGIGSGTKPRAAERAHNAGQLSPAEAWQQHVALVEFCWRLSPERSQWQRKEELAAWDHYYDSVRRLEAWRQARGKAA